MLDFLSVSFLGGSAVSPKASGFSKIFAETILAT
jgi:hypothetical protein